MRTTPLAFLLLTALVPCPGWTQETEEPNPLKAKPAVENEAAPVAAPTSVLRGKRVDADGESLFSDAEIGDLYKKAVKVNERTQPKAENNIYAVNAEGPIVELAPFTVDGGDDLLLAKVRREINRRPESVQRRLAELSPSLIHRAQDDARAQNSIMTQDFRAGPNDVPSTGGIAAGDVAHAVGDAIRAILAKEK